MQTSTPPDQSTRLHLRLFFAHGAMLGPGKAELLEHIRDTGSISAAGRAMDMSYKRAWMLVDAMNAAFAAPLVESARGGAGGGGAQVTEAGLAVLRLYRALQDKAARAGQAELEAITAMLRDIPEQK
ncbi:MAG: LysR family transcriptional regulator [Pseudomonadota bacterium]